MLQTKVNVGFLGHISSGKETCISWLRQLAESDGITISHHRFGDIPRKTLELWYQSPEHRPNCSAIVEAMKSIFGPDALTCAIRGAIANDNAKIICLDGIRLWPDAKFLRTLPNSLLVYITAPIERRWEWARERARKPGAEKPKEANMTLQEFIDQENSGQEKFITSIGKTAEFRIDNSGSLDQLYKKVVELYNEIYAM